jgi:hypothetical protein
VVHGLERPWVRRGEVIGGWRVAAPWYGCVWICREGGGRVNWEVGTWKRCVVHVGVVARWLCSCHIVSSCTLWPGGEV